MGTIELPIFILSVLFVAILLILVGSGIYLRRIHCRNVAEKENHLDSMFGNSPYGMCMSSLTGVPSHFNTALAETLGYTIDELHVATKKEYSNPTGMISRIVQEFNRNEIDLELPFEISLRHKDGHTIWFLITTTRFDFCKENMLLVNFVDISERKETEQVIYKLAYYDSLTELPNRAHFHEQSYKMLTTAGEEHSKLALFMIDIDDFKKVNDRMGHLSGDYLLKQISSRLADFSDNHCKCSHGCLCFVSRLGGDEFVLMIEGVETADQASQIAASIFKRFEAPIQIEEQSLHVSFSLGIALYPYDGNNVATLLKSADLALYAAKEKGKNQYHFHDASMNTRLEEHTQYEAVIGYFIDSGDFDLHYQPIVDAASGNLIGAEALFRGNTTRHQDLDLEMLINTAEETDLIIPLGTRILRRACDQWVQATKYRPNLTLSVNISMRQMDSDSIVNEILSTLYDTGLPASQLVIEITETVFTRKFKENVRKLDKLHKAGVTIAIDDFGKGYSSMSYIQQLPVSKLKIDMDFITKMVDDHKSAEIVKIIIMLASTLGLTTIAEGVETSEQYVVLNDLGCDQIQGYLCGAPMSIEKIKNLIDK